VTSPGGENRGIHARRFCSGPFESLSVLIRFEAALGARPTRNGVVEWQTHRLQAGSPVAMIDFDVAAPKTPIPANQSSRETSIVPIVKLPTNAHRFQVRFWLIND
jgi:hypothetical protein